MADRLGTQPALPRLLIAHDDPYQRKSTSGAHRAEISLESQTTTPEIDDFVILQELARRARETLELGPDAPHEPPSA